MYDEANCFNSTSWTAWMNQMTLGVAGLKILIHHLRKHTYFKFAMLEKHGLMESREFHGYQDFDKNYY
jgi:hypothetical protein